jgi:REP element-mobilizing transposase RayT
MALPNWINSNGGMHRKGYRALRRHRSSIPGQAYLLTTVCRDRHCLFADPDVATVVARTMSAAPLWSDARLLAWVLMPDHWHGLVQLGPQRPLSALMQRAKADASRDCALAFGLPPLWQAGFHERMVRSDVDLAVLARYVVANPIRAGLAERLEDYSYWGCVWGCGALEDPYA